MIRKKSTTDNSDPEKTNELHDALATVITRMLDEYYASKNATVHQSSTAADFLEVLAQKGWTTGRVSEGQALVERIQKMTTDNARRKLLRSWVGSGYSLNPIEAADVREEFVWITPLDEDDLRIATSRVN